MKFIQLQILNLILLFSLIVYIHSGTAKFIDVNNMNVYLNLNYLRLFSVPTSYISEYSDGGHGNNNLLENVFSYKYTGTWFTKIDTSNVNITVTFKKIYLLKK